MVLLIALERDTGNICVSRWQVWAWPQMTCGDMDMNFGFDDGSVGRLTGLGIPGDPRLVEVPEFANGRMHATAYLPLAGP